MNESMQRFFQQIDEALLPFANGQRLDLYHLGRSALVWRYQAMLTTKDIDVLQLGSALEEKARELFGRDSTKAKELGLYLDLVPEAFPPVSNGFRARSTEVPGMWKVIRLWELEANDFAATKMRRFHPQDRQDLQFLCDQEVLQSDKLRKSMEEAWIWYHPDDDRRDAAFANLALVIDYLEGRSANL